MVLCKTCGGTGYIINTTGYSSTGTTTVCPVCNGSKTQMVHETDSGSIIEGVQSGSISFTDAIRLMQ